MEASDLRVELDGKDLGWVPRQDIGLDRWHYDFYSSSDSNLSAGEHNLTFTLLNGERIGTAQMCSAEILEFGDESEYAYSFSCVLVMTDDLSQIRANPRVLWHFPNVRLFLVASAGETLKACLGSPM